MFVVINVKGNFVVKKNALTVVFTVRAFKIIVKVIFY